MEKRGNVYAKTEAGKWELIFRDIPESQADAIWMAGFHTGLNRISIEDETSRRFQAESRRALG